MSEFLNNLKKDWENVKEDIHDEIQKINQHIDEENLQTDQAFDYSNTGNPEEVLAESLYAQPQADKVITEAMESYQKSDKQKG